MRWRVLIVVMVALVVFATGAVAYAATHHSPACRGSYTYGQGVGHCGTSP